MKEKNHNSIYIEYEIMESINTKIKSEIPKICKLFNEKNIDYCLIGGASLPSYKLNRATEDVDFLVYANDRDKIENLIGTYFKSRNSSKRNLIWNEGNILIEFLFSGEVSGAEGGLIYEKPSELSLEKNGLKIITLPNLIQYKLSSGLYGRRLKDLADVEELIKLNNLKKNYCHENKFRKDLKKEWNLRWSNAIFDKNNMRD